MKPHKHARISAKKFKGEPEDYQEIHDFMDFSKTSHADVRHRSLLHHSLGIYICEKVFGKTFVNSAGRTISVRDVAEQHVLDDLGFIPSPSDYLKNMKIQKWMGGNIAKSKYIQKKRQRCLKLKNDGVKSKGEAFEYLEVNNGFVKFNNDKYLVGLSLLNGDDVISDCMIDAVNKLIQKEKMLIWKN